MYRTVCVPALSYVPVTTDYVYSSPYLTSISPLYPYVDSLHQTSREILDNTNSMKHDINSIRMELKEIRNSNSITPMDSCSICESRHRSRSRSPSPTSRRRDIYTNDNDTVHYCGICQDYVKKRPYSPPTPSPKHHRVNYTSSDDDELIYDYRNKYKYGSVSSLDSHPSYKPKKNYPSYLDRQIMVNQLRTRIPEQRPQWIPTGYKHDYPYRRWTLKDKPEP
ncbi:unnamed protein product [Didymodactylos carnosus]|uniref:Uncharacterized protein n=1 Tax=Didymodactylos carnosus TaxID=1234261 RepID=A0A815FP76_9BILA|nr:unnamed protein product [Didymodactylos carnosus]CAF1329053.1 unnamed protein product [Didymodactylos carnosus]CAF3624413.1 unnamed protein product [Didymodactylos carnosus]CAF4181176.1 unnamed protein product [Didymodactylos carnosus]